MKFFKKNNLSNLLFPAANILSSLLRLVAGVWNAKLLAPYLLGMFNTVNLVLGYIPLFQIGILTGLSRELPFFIGANNKKKAIKLAAAAQYWSFLVGAFGFISLLIISVYCYYIRKNSIESIGFLIFSFVSAITIYSAYYLQILYRTKDDFDKLSYIKIVEALLNLMLVVLVMYFSIYGMFLRVLITTVCTMILLYIWRPIRVLPKFDKKEIIHLLKIGFPIFIVSQIWLLWPILNSTLIVKALGYKSLGLFYIADILGKNIEFLPSSVNQMLYPKMAMDYGEKRSLSSIIRMIIKPILALLGVLFIANLTVRLIIPWVIGKYVPEYIESIDTVFVMVLHGSLFAFGIANNVFVVIKKQLAYLVLISIGILFYVLALLFFKHFKDLTLLNFAWSMVIGRVAFLLSSYIYIYYINATKYFEISE